MDTKLLDAIRIIMKQELKPIDTRLNNLELKVVKIGADLTKVEHKLKEHDYRFKAQDDKLDAMLEAWTIQKVHREELNDHEVRIQAIEHRIPAIS